MDEDADGRDMHHHQGGKAVDVKSEFEDAVPRGEQRKVDALRSTGNDVIEKIKGEEESENFGDHTDPRDLLTHQLAKRADEKARQKWRHQYEQRIVRQNHRVHQPKVINLAQPLYADGCQSTVDGRIESQCRDRRGCGGRQAKIIH